MAGSAAGLVLLCLVLAIPSPAVGQGKLAFSEGKLWGVVRTVVDASRIVVATADQTLLELRLAGVELPERARTGRADLPDIPGQPFGEEAAVFVRNLILDTQVRVDTYGRDAAGRLLAVIWLGEISVNLALVKEGLAWVDPTFSVTRVRAGLEVAERQAQVGRYGLWALADPEPPWKFRRRHGLAPEPGR